MGLLSLPLEIVQEISRHLFHPPSGEIRPCERVDVRRGQLGCRCGEGLSVSCRRFYESTRNLYFNCAKFLFKSPSACQRYLGKIGKRCNQIGSLELEYTNSIHESNLLRAVFEHLRDSQRLYHLNLIIHERGGQHRQGFPMYMPDQIAYNDAQLWDVLYRPISHPLAHLKSVRKLTVVGHPGSGEIEEVLYHARKNVEATMRYLPQGVAASVSSWNTRLNMINFVIGTVPDEEWRNWHREYH